MSNGNGNIEGISFTAKDLDALELVVQDYLTRLVPEISDVSQANPGRLLIRLQEGFVDALNYGIDVALIESLWGVSQQKRNMIEQAKGIGWYYPGVSPARVQLKFNTSIPMPAGSGGLTIPRFLVCQTSETPPRRFVTVETGFVPELSAEAIVDAVEGERVILEEITTNASGESLQRYLLSANRAPFEFVQVFVNGIEWERQERNLLESSLVDQHFVCRALETDPLRTFILFGNDEFGVKPPAGARIEATYIKSNGPDGNVEAESINKIVGPFSTPFEGDPTVLGNITVSVINEEAAAGGSDGPTVDEIRAKAPFEQQTRGVYVTEEDFRAGAESISGVFTASVVDVIGSTATIIVMPEGGDIAPQALLDEVQTELQDGTLIGAIIQTESVQHAEILLTADVQILRSDISRQEAREDIINAVVAASDWRVQEIGRGFRVSDIDAIIKGVNDGNIVDFLTVTRLTRIPRVEKSDPALPDMQGNIRVGTGAGYHSYVIQADTTDVAQKRYVVTRGNEVVFHQNGDGFGELGVEFEASDASVTFTLGTTLDTITAPGLITFSTSKFLGNLRLAREEIMRISNLNQLEINIFFPGELNAFA